MTSREIKKNGGWCWFQGPRAIVTREGRVVFTTISGDTYGGYDAGDLVATAWNPETNDVEHFTLHAQFERDDHDVAGLLERPDGRILAVYAKHSSDRSLRRRITVDPGDISAWNEETQTDAGDRLCYSNVFRLAAEDGRIYSFGRGIGFNPNCLTSDDGGDTWNYGWRLLSWTRQDLADDPRYTGIDGTRPYLRYASNGEDEIHFVASDDHPRAYDNSLYHGFYRGGGLHDSLGNHVGDPGRDGTSDLKPNSFTEFFKGSADAVAWPCDFQLDANGRPYVSFSVQVDGADTRTDRRRGGLDHRYGYARFDGRQWHTHLVAHAGTRLYQVEADYTGLAALDPDDPNTMVISTDADPDSGEPLTSSADGKRHYELYRGAAPATPGDPWTWMPLTENSTVDNLRPVIPANPGGKRYILWGRGDLSTYTDYRLDVHALVEDR